MNVWHLVYFVISTTLFVWLLINYIRVIKLMIRLADIKDVAKSLTLVAQYFDFLNQDKNID